MLPAEEYTYLKRKYEAEKAAKAQAKRLKQPSYDATAFAHAIHGMPGSPKPHPPRKDSSFRMKAGKPTRPQPKYVDKKKCPQVYVPPKKKAEYSSPQVRRNYAYKPAGLSGKAGEVLGVTNKRMYKGKQPSVSTNWKPKPPQKMRKPVVKNATKPLPALPKGCRPPKKSTGCVVM